MSLEKLKVAELKQIAESHGLEAKGTKQELITAIRQKINNEAIQQYKAENKPVIPTYVEPKVAKINHSQTQACKR